VRFHTPPPPAPAPKAALAHNLISEPSAVMQLQLVETISASLQAQQKRELIQELLHRRKYSEAATIALESPPVLSCRSHASQPFFLMPFPSLTAVRRGAHSGSGGLLLRGNGAAARAIGGAKAIERRRRR